MTGPVTVPAISLPKSGGPLRGVDEKYAANPAAGSGSLTVPLWLSAARANSTLQLQLTPKT
jgi:hypothetical protein